MFPLSWRLTFGIQSLLLLVFHLLCAGGFNQSNHFSRTWSSHIFFVGSTGNCEWAKSWVNVYFDTNTTCQRLWDQLAHGKLAKSLHIWANLKRGGQTFPERWMHVFMNDWLVCTKSSNCKSFSLNVIAPDFSPIETTYQY